MDILNIGLQTKGGTTLEPRAVIAGLIGRRIAAVSCGVHASDTEPTLVVVTDCITDLQAYRIAEALDQDCIAVYHVDTGRGRLFGPDAAAWGVFTPEYFIMPDGQRLVRGA